MALRYMLDTNVFIRIRQRRPGPVLDRFQALGPNEAVVSVVSYGETVFGVEKGAMPRSGAGGAQRVGGLHPGAAAPARGRSGLWLDPRNARTTLDEEDLMSTFNDPVTEQDLPGIGRRYQMTDDSGHVITVIVHHSGRRDVYVPRRGSERGRRRQLHRRPGPAARRPARRRLLQARGVAQVEAVIGGLLIDWVTLHEGSPGVGRSIADLEIRRRTRMTIAAIVRDDAPLVAPDPIDRARGR